MRRFVNLIRHRFLLVLALITAFGFALRLSTGIELVSRYRPASSPAATTDMATYQEFANAVVTQTFDYNNGFYYQPFYYTVFLPSIYAFSTNRPHAVVVAQSIVGAICIWFVGLSFARIFGKHSGALAALIVAIYRYLIFYTPFTLIAVLQTFWITLLLYCGTVAMTRKQYRWWAALGLVNGLAVVTRGNAILFTPLLVGAAVYCHRHQPRQLTIATLLVITLTWLPGLPYSLVNYHAHGKWIGPSSAGASVLALGNTPESPPGGREANAGAGPMEYPRSYQLWSDQDRAQGAEHVSIFQNMWRWFRAEPMAYLELKFRMLLLFVNRAEIPNNVALTDINGQSVPSATLQLPFLLSFMVVGSLALIGITLCALDRRQRRRPMVLFAIGLIVIYSLSIILFYVLSRFRLPIIPLLAGFAAFAIITLLHRAQRTRHRHKWGVIIAIAATSFTIVGYGYDSYRYAWEHRVMRWVRPDGVHVHLPDGFTVKDHGPFSFGGWVTYPLDTGSQLEKRLQLPRRIGSNEDVVARLLITGSPGSQGRIRIGHEPPHAADITVPRSGQLWYEYSLPPPYRLDDDAMIRIPLIVDAVDGIHLVLDQQRAYDRTTIDGHPSENGELVIELEVKTPSQ